MFLVICFRTFLNIFVNQQIIPKPGLVCEIDPELILTSLTFLLVQILKNMIKLHFPKANLELFRLQTFETSKKVLSQQLTHDLTVRDSRGIQSSVLYCI